MRKRVLLIGAVLAAVMLAGSVGLFVWQVDRPGVTRRNYDRIQVGMTPSEVEAILGAPPDVWMHLDAETGKEVEEGPGARWEVRRDCRATWYGDRSFIRIYFDPDGKVYDKIMGVETSASPSLADRLRAWLGL